MTLNQVIKEITKIGEKHSQIKFVFFGDVWERLSNGEVSYPALFLTLADASISAKHIEYRFSIYIMDRVLSGNENEIEILSDMTLIGQDVVAQLRHPSQQWVLSDSLPISYYTESDPDYLGGIKIDITLTLPSINDRCQVPSEYDI